MRLPSAPSGGCEEKRRHLTNRVTNRDASTPRRRSMLATRSSSAATPTRGTNSNDRCNRPGWHFHPITRNGPRANRKAIPRTSRPTGA